MHSLTLKTEPSDDPRRSVSRLYKRTGVFDWADRLRAHGVESPVRVIFLIGCMLASPRTEDVPDDEPAAGHWIDTALARTWQQHGQQPVRPLAELAAAVSPMLQWDPWDELAELMAVRCGPAVLRSVRGQLASKGLGLDYIELHDLAAQFAGDHIRAALSSFDVVRGEGKEAAWLGTVFYRFALKHVLISRRMRQAFDAAFELPDPGAAPEEVIERQVENAALQALPRALAQLQPAQREAVLRYFGLGYHEHTLAEVAQALSTNVYFARIAVITGVGAVAAVLGIPGLLDDEELRVAQLMFSQSHDVDSTADALDMTPAHVRRVAARMGTKLRRSLRARTTTATPPATTPSAASRQKETDMSHVELLPAFVAACTSDHLTLQQDDKGELWARFLGADQPLHVAALLNAMRLRPELMERLVDGTPEEQLARLFTPSPSETRRDVMTDHAQWGAMLDAASANSLANAAVLFHAWSAACQALNVDLPERLGEREAAARIRDSLSAVTSALEEMIPWSARQEGRSVLQIAFPSPSVATAYWSSAAQVNGAMPLNLGGLVRDRLALVGQFDGPALDLLTGCVLQGLHEQTINLPGLSKTKARGDELVAYEWWRADLADLE
jgi:hypothetical protein